MNGRKDWGGYEGQDRRTNGEWMAGIPSWAKFISIIGPTSAIAIFLVWVGANEIPKIARQTQQNHDAIMRTQELVIQHQEQSAAMFRMLQRICSNTARNETERERCFDK